ncbi:hypothetical protein M427DRAFT_67396 [Gonapodya prolifera JEL478]|uniref:DNA 3'-5' helicase n=1 Tax=Gonapodya prolifera (strain JEL478) TaxID=1344416 RepID=A0A139ARZ2_GONPJ|nr:hypothetical protein M427DRAFT_67396 [Gonapodya prolifera JEL478]|eukprot:KXS19313.1 hypothetical protein M427DRAFT_67396 [Gonapodya prolifera JEL478]
MAAPPRATPEQYAQFQDLKVSLKLWEKEFERRTGFVPSKADVPKELMPQYKTYARLRKLVKASEQKDLDPDMEQPRNEGETTRFGANAGRSADTPSSKGGKRQPSVVYVRSPFTEESLRRSQHAKTPGSHSKTGDSRFARREMMSTLEQPTSDAFEDDIVQATPARSKILDKSGVLLNVSPSKRLTRRPLEPLGSQVTSNSAKPGIPHIADFGSSLDAPTASSVDLSEKMDVDVDPDKTAAPAPNHTSVDNLPSPAHRTSVEAETSVNVFMTSVPEAPVLPSSGPLGAQINKTGNIKSKVEKDPRIIEDEIHDVETLIGGLKPIPKFHQSIYVKKLAEESPVSLQDFNESQTVDSLATPEHLLNTVPSIQSPIKSDAFDPADFLLPPAGAFAGARKRAAQKRFPLGFGFDHDPEVDDPDAKFVEEEVRALMQQPRLTPLDEKHPFGNGEAVRHPEDVEEQDVTEEGEPKAQKDAPKHHKAGVRTKQAKAKQGKPKSSRTSKAASYDKGNSTTAGRTPKARSETTISANLDASVGGLYTQHDDTDDPRQASALSASPFDFTDTDSGAQWSARWGKVRKVRSTTSTERMSKVTKVAKDSEKATPKSKGNVVLDTQESVGDITVESAAEDAILEAIQIAETEYRSEDIGAEMVEARQRGTSPSDEDDKYGSDESGTESENEDTEWDDEVSTAKGRVGKLSSVSSKRSSRKRKVDEESAEEQPAKKKARKGTRPSKKENSRGVAKKSSRRSGKSGSDVKGGALTNNFVSLKLRSKPIGGGRGRFGKGNKWKFVSKSSVGSSYSLIYDPNKRTMSGAYENPFGEHDNPGLSIKAKIDGRKKWTPTLSFVVDDSEGVERCLLSQNFFDHQNQRDQKFMNVDLRAALNDIGAGHNSFRPGQLDVIKDVLGGKSLLAIMPTGSGKSLCFQLPAFILSRAPNIGPSLTLVITPTIALMEDQIRCLPLGLRGAALSSHHDVAQVMTQLEGGEIDILFITPERLCSRKFVEALSSGKCPRVRLACVDEAHCLSEWSHNFRPTYLHINSILRYQLNVPCILALTGTATLDARRDISNMLELKEVYGSCSVNKNLVLTASRESEREPALVSLLRSPHMKNLEGIIVYCMRKDQCDSVAAYLRVRGFTADSYHAGRTLDERMVIQNDFLRGKLRVVVATVAFGLGINKADVRAVIHYSLPKSLENYVQEIGRAGRDGMTAYCHIFLNREEYTRLRSFAFADTPDEVGIGVVLRSIFGPLQNESSNAAKKKSNSKRQQEHAKELYLKLDDVATEADMKKEVLETLISYLEFERGGTLINVFQKIHSTCRIRFTKGSKEDLASENRLVAAILKNGLVEEGVHVVDIPSLAKSIDETVEDVITELYSLKGKKEIYPEFLDESAHIKVLQQLSQIEIGELQSDLVKKVGKLETSRVEKVDQLYKAIQSVAAATIAECEPILPRLGTPPPDVDDDIMHLDDEAFSGGKTASATLAEQVLKYFQDPKEERLGNNGKRIVSRWGFVDPLLIDNQKAMEFDMVDAVKVLAWRNRDKIKSVRAVARILHGIPSPQYPQSQWGEHKSWAKYRQFNFRELMRIAREALTVDAGLD